MKNNHIRKKSYSNILSTAWERKKLGEICFMTSGGTPSRRNLKFYNGNIPWVKSGELNYNIIRDTEEKITKEAIEYSSAKIFPKGTLLIALYGATIGKLGILGVDASTNQAVCGIYENDKIITKFLYWYLFSKRQEFIKIGFGGAQPNISQTILKDFDIPIPPLPIQNQIVEKIEELFSELDNGVEELIKIKEKIKIYRQSVLSAAFSGRLTNKNLKNGELPKGWKKVNLGKIAMKITIKVLPKNDSNLKFIGMDCIEPHTLVPKFLYKFKDFKSSGNYFEKGQVLYGRMRPYLNKVYKAEFDGACSGEFIVLQCEKEFNPGLLKYILHSREFVSYANNKTSGDRPRISYEEISDFSIKLPPVDEQQKIVEKIDLRLSVSDKIEEIIETALAQSESLRQSILKQAFEEELII